MNCPACRAEIPDGARFCPSCGTELHVLGDQRRVVTVLFADLVGYTALSERRDPEQVKQVVDACFERLVADIEAFGGRVDKIVGDAVLALFGAPIAHEDDPERAVRAALQLHRTVAAVKEELGFDLRLRVGLDSGEVLVGGLRAGGDYTAMGDVVNTAQRLQTAAEPGQVLVGQATYLATRRAVTYRSAGAIAAKGKDAPVQAWVAEGAALPPGYRSDRHRTPLVGRDDEVALLTHTLRVAVSRRRAALLLLVGEAGLGKSRLVEEAAEQARCTHDTLVLQGRCVPYGEANVWWPIADAVRSGCGVVQGDSDEAVVRKVRTAVADAVADPKAVDRVVDGLLHLLGFEGVLDEVDAARARDEATRALLVFAAEVARRRPIAVVLSDLHWADDAVLDVLGAMLDANARLPFVVLATARPSLADRWSPPEGGHHTVVVHLDPLEREAAAELLRCLAGDRMAALDDAVVDDMLDRASGNPFFLEELVSWLEGSHATDVPDTLRGLVAARLDDLTRAERRVLEDAAVLGSSGRVDWLALMHREVHGSDEPVAGALAGLEARDLVAVDANGWEFRSELVRDVAYGTMTKQRRAKVHAGIAGWLAGQKPPHHDALVDRVAHHYARAAELTAELGVTSTLPYDVIERAVQWLRTAGERAAHAHTPRRARQLFTEALALLDTGPTVAVAPGGASSSDRIELLLARAAVLGDLREMDPARADAEAARALAEAMGEESLVVRAVVQLADVAVKAGAPGEADVLLEQALARAAAAGDDAGSAAALRVRGFGALMRNDPEAAVASLEPALSLYTALGDRRGRAWALQNLSWAHFIGGRIDDAEQLLHDSAALFGQIGDKGGLSWALGLLAFTRFYSGYTDEAEAMSEEAFGAADAADAAGDRWAQGMGHVLTSSIHLWTGRAESAIGQAETALTTFDAIGDAYGRIQAALPLGRALVTAGRIDEGFAVLEKARESLLPSNSPRYVAFSAAGLLGAAVQIGDRGRAANALAVLPADRLSSDDLTTVGAGEFLVSQALLALQRSCPSEALALLSQVERAVGERARVGYSGAVRALTLAAGDQLDEALAAAEMVDGDHRSTYLDRLWAGMAAALVAARRGERAAVDARFEGLCAALDATDDRVGQALARLGWATALDVVGGERKRRADEAASRFGELGIDPHGWTVALASAAGRTAAAA